MNLKKKADYFLEKIHKLHQLYVRPSIVLPRGQIAENDYVIDLFNLNTEMFQSIKALTEQNEKLIEALRIFKYARIDVESEPNYHWKAVMKELDIKEQ